jgi:hypothetical protein
MPRRASLAGVPVGAARATADTCRMWRNALRRERCLRFVRIFGACSKRYCARRAIGHRHQPDGFSGGKKLVACFLKLVARILKSEPLIFSLLPCEINTLKISFHFSAPENAFLRQKFSTRGYEIHRVSKTNHRA